MTRGVAISMALLAIIVLPPIVLLAWPTHSASDSPIGTDDLVGMVDPRFSQANIQVTICRRQDADRAARAVTDAIKRNLAADLGRLGRMVQRDHAANCQSWSAPATSPSIGRNTRSRQTGELRTRSGSTAKAVANRRGDPDAPRT